MKHINIIFRTLCLTALLCMTSANASAYVVYDGQGDIILNPETMGDNRIMVVEGEVTVNSIEVSNDYVLIILPGARVTNEYVFYGGDIYVFGALRINTSIYGLGEIYLVVGGEFDGIKTSAPPLHISPLNTVSATRKVGGKAPTDTEDGWMDYWEGEITCGDDAYPLEIFFEDEAHTKLIKDLESWKQGAGKIYSLPLHRSEALAAINAAMKDLAVIQKYKDQVDGYISAIEAAKTVEDIEGSKAAALDIIALWEAMNEINEAKGSLVFFPKYKTDFEGCISAIENAGTVDAINEAKTAALAIIEKQKVGNIVLEENFGDLFTKQDGNMVEIIGQKGETIKLYNPKKVNFKKVNE